ncbi:hypothetical protein D3C72_1973090 [compost metagenome]
MKSWLIPCAIVTTYLCAFTQLFEGILGAGSGQALSSFRQQEGSVAVERLPFAAFDGILDQHRCQICSGRHQPCPVELALTDAKDSRVQIHIRQIQTDSLADA